ncbi:MAG TPA: pantoate--beta-alanine ligase [Clostridiaceae bacterium]
MEVVNNILDVRTIVKAWKKNGYTVGLVPTMGYLHEGHKSLIEKCNKENDKTVVSIFVNPIQFGPNEDFQSYPRNLEMDKNLCLEAGTDLIFNPDASELYEKEANTYVEVLKLTEGLCGEKRPVHFKGVCTVVSKLFNIITPDKAYFGKKDAQQLAVIKKMVLDLDFDIQVLGCEIVREKDGLAKSSRNTYLSPSERKAALVLSRSLNLALDSIKAGNRDAESIKDIIKGELKSEPLAKIDYIEVVNSLSLQRVDTVETSVLVPIAVFIGKTRLIDNFDYEIKEEAI